MAKLENVKAINQLLRGEHKWQTRKSYTFYDAADAALKNERHEVGDIWHETDVVTGHVTEWEQRQGYRIKRSTNTHVFDDVHNFLSSFPNCQKETCECVAPTNLDKKFRNISGMCSECHIGMETKLKIAGKFDDYARQKLATNAVAFFKDADVELEVLKRMMRTQPTFHNSDGKEEKWELENIESNISMIETNYTAYKNNVLSYYGIVDKIEPSDDDV